MASAVHEWCQLYHLHISVQFYLKPCLFLSIKITLNGPQPPWCWTLLAYALALGWKSLVKVLTLLLKNPESPDIQTVRHLADIWNILSQVVGALWHSHDINHFIEQEMFLWLDSLLEMFLLIVPPTEGLDKEQRPQLLGWVYQTQFFMYDVYYNSQKLLAEQFWWMWTPWRKISSSHVQVQIKVALKRLCPPPTSNIRNSK